MATKETLKQTPDALVRRLWHYCNILRDDGLSYPDYVEQLTYLLFLKMSEEQGNVRVPAQYSWRSFAGLDAKAMHAHYGRALDALGKSAGMLGFIFGNAKNKIRDPAKLRLLIVDLIGQMDWSSLSPDLKGDAYEGLLEKNARDTKSGAGQYFTPRPLIDAIVECIDPKVGESICDPACGTGGFLLSAYAHVRSRKGKITNREARVLATKMIHGVDLVPEVARLAAMNLLLHGISGASDSELPVECADSLKEVPTRQFDVVLTNPPFGVKGSITYSGFGGRSPSGGDELSIVRPDFWVQTANKQLNFLQHIVSLLRSGGRAAVVVPDNVLFEEGIAAASIRRRLLAEFDLHTILRLPAGLFYAHSVKSNVMFFDKPKRRRAGGDGRLWVYNLRDDAKFSIKTRPLRRQDLDDFTRLFKSKRQVSSSTARWKAYAISPILETDDCSLDLGASSTPASPRTPSMAKITELSDLVAADLHRALDHLSKATKSTRDT